jgi:O-antigen/teichoic acid export membrane protein
VPPETHTRPGLGDLTPETIEEKNRLNRNLDQLLNELRVALPGVQVLFAFLLSVPFATRFSRTIERQRVEFFVALLLSAAAAACLIAPSMHHRMLFRQGRKATLVAVANRLTIIGLLLLAAAIAGSILLVGDFVFGLAAGIALATGTLVVFMAIWAGIPVWLRLRDGRW